MTIRTRILPRASRGLLLAWFLVPLVPIVLWAASNRWSFPAALPQVWGVDGFRNVLAAGAVDASGALVSVSSGDVVRVQCIESS